MSDLDKKLEGIGVYDVDDSRYTELGWFPEVIDQIKQAFIDDGWVRGDQAKVLQELMNLKVNTEAALHRLSMSQIVGEDRMTKEEWERQAVKDGWVGPDDDKRQLMDPLPMNTLTPPNKVMTDQERYDKFWKEFGESNMKADQLADRAAKKAAGIE